MNIGSQTKEKQSQVSLRDVNWWLLVWHSESNLLHSLQ